MQKISTFKTVLTALFTAMICVATMLVRIPIPATGGYANLGDGVILICAFLMPALYGVLAAGIGSMLADILAGYMTFAPGTLIIKAGVALIASLIYRRWGKSQAPGRSLTVMVISGIFAEIFMVLGYFVYEAVFMGAGLGAAGAIVGNIGQGIVGVIVACIVAPALTRSHEISEMMNKL